MILSLHAIEMVDIDDDNFFVMILQESFDFIKRRLHRLQEGRRWLGCDHVMESGIWYKPSRPIAPKKVPR